MTYRITNLPIDLTHDAVTSLAASLGISLLSPPSIQTGAVEVEVAESFTPEQLAQFETVIRNSVLSKIGKIVSV